MNLLASFDLEIAKMLPEGENDWQKHRPLGISCVSTAERADGRLKISDCQGRPQMTQEHCRRLVGDLLDFVSIGGMFVTVNGVGFDFAILAEESGMVAECAQIALDHHCDLMFVSLCHFGWPTGLDALAKGAGVESKLKQVTLKDGTILGEMGGAKAPELWAAGEYEAVLAYLRQDVISTLETAETAVARERLAWRSKTGRYWSVPLPNGLPTVREMLDWDRPDTSWMTNPLDPHALAAWALER